MTLKLTNRNTGKEFKADRQHDEWISTFDGLQELFFKKLDRLDDNRKKQYIEKLSSILALYDDVSLNFAKIDSDWLSFDLNFENDDDHISIYFRMIPIRNSETNKIIRFRSLLFTDNATFFTFLNSFKVLVTVQSRESEKKNKTISGGVFTVNQIALEYYYKIFAKTHPDFIEEKTKRIKEIALNRGVSAKTLQTAITNALKPGHKGVDFRERILKDTRNQIAIQALLNPDTSALQALTKDINKLRNPLT